MKSTSNLILCAFVALIAFTTVAERASYVSCEVTYSIQALPPPTTGYTQKDVCQYGICHWYHEPACGQNCMVEVCFASQNPE